MRCILLYLDEWPQLHELLQNYGENLTDVRGLGRGLPSNPQSHPLALVCRLPCIDVHYVPSGWLITVVVLVEVIIKIIVIISTY